MKKNMIITSKHIDNISNESDVILIKYNLSLIIHKHYNTIIK